MTDQSTEAGDLYVVADNLVELGFSIRAIGRHKGPLHAPGFADRPVADITQEALRLLRKNRGEGLAVVLGARGSRHQSKVVSVPLALELEGRATKDPAFMAEWEDAVTEREAKELMDRLRRGWCERTPSGGLRWFFELEFGAQDEFEFVTRHLPNQSRAARRKVVLEHGEEVRTFAEILVDSAIVAPSGGEAHETGDPWERAFGGPETIPTVTVDELFVLADILAAVSDHIERQDLAGGVLGIMDDRTFETRSAFNRAWGSTASTVQRLIAHGWTVDTRATVEDGEVALHKDGHAKVRVGGRYRPQGSAWTFSTSALPLPAGTLLTAFDVALLTSHDKRVQSASDLAELLLSPVENDNGGTPVTLRPRVLAPRSAPNLDSEMMRSGALAQALLDALIGARHPLDRGQPFVVLHGASNGRLVTVDSSGRATIWGAGELGQLLLVVAQQVRYTSKGPRFRHGWPPAIVAAVAGALASGSGVPSVSIVAAAPVVLPDGSLLSEPGLHLSKRALLAIPRSERLWWKAGYQEAAQVTQAAAQAELDWLLHELLGDFPFVTSGDTARAVVYVLTVVMRYLAPTVPAFGFTAPDRGTGKSKLARLPRYIVYGTGRHQSIGFSRAADEEIAKVVATAMLNGVPYLHVDELPRDSMITSTVLSELITAEDGTMNLRILGGNKTVSALQLILTVCGNNISLGADMNRRFIEIRLGVPSDSGVLPQHRTGFRHPNLERWVLEHRPQLLAACHKIVAHGLKNPVSAEHLPTGFGSFERWAEVFLGALSHLKIDGQNAAWLVADGRARWEASQDDEASDWRPVMEAIYGIWRDDFVKVSEIHNRITKRSPAVDLPPELAKLSGQAPQGAIRSWSRALKARRDTAVAGTEDGVLLRLQMIEDDKRGSRFRVKKVTAEPEKGATPPGTQDDSSRAIELPPIIDIVAA